MKLTNKKGFTIVELVIVIAVIAILAAVLVPTFSSLIDKANDSKALQIARNVWMEYIAEHEEAIDKDFEITFTDLKDSSANDVAYVFYVIDGEIGTTAGGESHIKLSVTDGKATVVASNEGAETEDTQNS